MEDRCAGGGDRRTVPCVRVFPQAVLDRLDGGDRLSGGDHRDRFAAAAGIVDGFNLVNGKGLFPRCDIIQAPPRNVAFGGELGVPVGGCFSHSVITFRTLRQRITRLLFTVQIEPQGRAVPHDGIVVPFVADRVGEQRVAIDPLASGRGPPGDEKGGGVRGPKIILKAGASGGVVIPSAFGEKPEVGRQGFGETGPKRERPVPGSRLHALVEVIGSPQLVAAGGGTLSETRHAVGKSGGAGNRHVTDGRGERAVKREIQERGGNIRLRGYRNEKGQDA